MKKPLAAPSPTSDHLYVSGPLAFDSTCELWILDATGRMVSRTRYLRNGPVSVSDLASGTYQIVLKDLLTGAMVYRRFMCH